MNIVILNYTTGDIDYVHGIPDDVDDLSSFVYGLGYRRCDVDFMEVDETTRINWLTYNNGQLEQMINNNGYAKTTRIHNN